MSNYGPRTLASLLRPSVKRDVLERFIHRFTMDHVPQWALKMREDGTYYAPQFRSDEEWLSNTVVRTRKDGELDGRFSACETRNATWPLGQSLAEPYRKPVKVA